MKIFSKFKNFSLDFELNVSTFIKIKNHNLWTKHFKQSFQKKDIKFEEEDEDTTHVAEAIVDDLAALVGQQ
jgi:hypothetical protein